MKHVLVYGMTDNPGGIETYLLNFFQRVQGHGVMLDFVSDFPSISGDEILQSRGSQLYYIPAKSKDLQGHWKALWRILREHKEYTCVYFNVLDAGTAVTMLVPYLMGRRIAVHAHNNSTEKKGLHTFCKPLLGLLAHGLAACSESAAEYMFGRRSKDCLVIPNVIDAKKYRFDPAARQKKRKELAMEDAFVVCHVGRLAEQKNPGGLLDIFEELYRNCDDARLLSVGDGELSERFKADIAQRGLQNAVICLGARSDIPEILQAADIFLFPSLYEGFGISVLEAQAAGLPCVISDVIPKQATVTDLVHPISLKAPVEVWVQRILECRNTERADTYQSLCEAGYDVSCCEEFDSKLIAMF